MPWTATIERCLADDRGLPSGEIVRWLREEHGYAGGKIAVYELVRRVRPVAVAPMVRFEGVAGEFSQHDFGRIDIRYDSGRRERIRFFASRLERSRVAHFGERLIRLGGATVFEAAARARPFAGRLTRDGYDLDGDSESRTSTVGISRWGHLKFTERQLPLSGSSPGQPPAMPSRGPSPMSFESASR